MMPVVTPVLQVRLLGDFLLVSDELPMIAIDSPRLRSLLAYLMLHSATPQSRSHLAFLLWPDSSEEQAHTNLRTVVIRLRQALPNLDDFLHIDRRSLHWRPTVACVLDVMDFEQALVQAERAKDARTERQALEKAVGLYQGDLLPDCYDEWVLSERDRLRQLFLEALERLVELLEQEQNYSAAIRAAQRLIRHDSLHETAYRHLMRLYARNGNRAALARTYQACVTVLERELAVGPSSATRRVYEQYIQTEESWTTLRVSALARVL
jgi:DNA-binding SARP family transcriptional activator